MESKKVLVSGGAGFIGSHVANYLADQGNKVVVFDNFVGGKDNLKYFGDEIEVFEGDMTDRNACKKALNKVDAVFCLGAHAAEGQSVFIPIFNAETNLMGSITLLTESINAGIKDFVFTSTIAAYGKPEKLPIREDAPLMPEDPYGVTKMAFEHYLRVYYELEKINPYIVRFFNVYGPRQRMDDPYRGVVPIFINKCFKGENPIIFGDGLQKRAFTYISDIVEPICSIVGKKKLINNPVNIGAEKAWTVKELAEKIIEKTGSKVEIEHVDKRTSDVKVVYADVSKAKKLLDYEAKVGFDEGIEKTIEWAKGEGIKDFKYMDYFEIPKMAHGIYKTKDI